MALIGKNNCSEDLLSRFHITSLSAQRRQPGYQLPIRTVKSHLSNIAESFRRILRPPTLELCALAANLSQFFHVVFLPGEVTRSVLFIPGGAFRVKPHSII